jgi:hypothetical protein
LGGGTFNIRVKGLFIRHWKDLPVPVSDFFLSFGPILLFLVQYLVMNDPAGQLLMLPTNVYA